MRYLSLKNHLGARYGARVSKISLDAGLNCPNRDGRLSRQGCLFCNEKGSGTGAAALGLSVREQIAAGLARGSRRAEKFIAYFQSFTNTYAPPDRLRTFWDQALEPASVVAMSVGTRPDCVPDNILDLLAGYRPRKDVWLEMGLQSSSDETLQRIRRGHTAADFADAARRARARGLDVVAHVIIGLPGEGERDILETAGFVSALDLQGVKIHSMYVPRGTGLAQWLENGRYHCLSQDEYVRLAVLFLEHIPSGMVIHRLTGDPDPDRLAAPEWSLRKSETINLIRKRLDELDTWQGKRLGAPAPDRPHR